MMSIKAVMFDLDGTLTDTIRDIANAMNRSLRLNGLPEHPVEAYKLFVGNGVKVLAQRVVGDRQEMAEVVLAEYQAYYQEHTQDTTCPYPGVPEMLDAMIRKGLRLCVLSNKPDADTKGVVAHFFPNIAFEIVQGQKAGVPVKPDPTAATSIAERMGLKPEEFLYLGDSGVDMQTAVNTGMHPLGVLWGFRQEEELRACGAAWVAANTDEVMTIVDSLM